MKEVIILAMGNEWEKCPFDKETWVIGKMLLAPETLKRVDKAFWMDNLDHAISIQRGLFTRKEFVEKINKSKVPFISCKKYPDIPLSEEFPLISVLNIFRIPYFSNTICYMIAYALIKGYEKIELWGVCLSVPEYMAQKAAVEWWLGLAVGRGLAVSVKTPSALLKTGDGYLYGYHKKIKTIQYATQKEEKTNKGKS